MIRKNQTKDEEDKVGTQGDYGLRDQIISAKVETKVTPIRELVIPHNHRRLSVSYPAFGPGTYEENILAMRRNPISSWQGTTFREPSTSESISIAYVPLISPIEGVSTRQFFSAGGHHDPFRCLDLGLIVKTKEGVFANPPKDEMGRVIHDEEYLKTLLKGSEKVKGVYLGENDFGFAPYETFLTGTDTHTIYSVRSKEELDSFKENGLAILLENARSGKADKMGKILENIGNGHRGGIMNVDVGEIPKRPSVEVISINAKHSNSYGCRVTGLYSYLPTDPEIFKSQTGIVHGEAPWVQRYMFGIIESSNL